MKVALNTIDQPTVFDVLSFVEEYSSDICIRFFIIAFFSSFFLLDFTVLSSNVQPSKHWKCARPDVTAHIIWDRCWPHWINQVLYVIGKILLKLQCLCEVRKLDQTDWLKSIQIFFYANVVVQTIFLLHRAVIIVIVW